MKKILLISWLCLSVTAGLSQRSHIITAYNAESPLTIGDFGGGVQNSGHSYNIKISDSIVLAGSDAYRFEIYKGEGLSSAGSYRTEAVFSPEGAVIKSRKYGIGIYLKNWVSDPKPEIIWQYHSQNGCDCQPPIDFTVQNNHIIFHNYSISGTTLDQGHEIEYEQDLGTVTNNGWMKFVMIVTFDYHELDDGGTGHIQVYKDNILVIDITGPNIFNEMQPLYEKMGIYKYPWDPANVFYDPITASPEDSRLAWYDEAYVGDESSTYDDVYPGDPESPSGPTANATITPTSCVDNCTVTVDGSGSTGTGITFDWTQIAGPAATITDHTMANTTIILPSPGTYQFQLTVTDDGSLTSTVVKTITVSTSTPPPPTPISGSFRQFSKAVRIN